VLLALEVEQVEHHPEFVLAVGTGEDDDEHLQFEAVDLLAVGLLEQFEEGLDGLVQRLHLVVRGLLQPFAHDDQFGELLDVQLELLLACKEVVNQHAHVV